MTRKIGGDYEITAEAKCLDAGDEIIVNNDVLLQIKISSVGRSSNGVPR